MAEDRSLTRLLCWHAALRAERARRFNSTGTGAAFREQLIARLDEMGARLRADPDFVEPDPAESRKALNDWFRAHGYKARVK